MSLLKPFWEGLLLFISIYVFVFGMRLSFVLIFYLSLLGLRLKVLDGLRHFGKM